jgi:hypothetical protein
VGPQGTWERVTCIALTFEIELFSFSSKRPKKIQTSFYKCFEGCLNANLNIP